MKVRGRKVSGGTASGPVALSSASLSFLGEIDPATGRVDNPASELNGRTVTDRVLVFPQARGSTVGPYVIYGARKRGVGPVAMVVHEADAIVASAAVIARIPCVDGVDLDLFRDGESVVVLGDEGAIDFPQVKGAKVVTAMLEDEQGRVLMLKRSETVGTFQGLWGGVSGYLEAPSALEQAYREIEEETGLPRESLTMAREARPVYARHESTIFQVHPIYLRASRTEVRLNSENTDFAWVSPSEIEGRPTVPKLREVWKCLQERLPPTGDTTHRSEAGAARTPSAPPSPS